jgi:tetratricopeptide (TPR) repeat protein
MGRSHLLVWTVTAAAIPMVVPSAVIAQTSAGMSSSDVVRNDPVSGKIIEPGPKKPPRRSRARTSPKKNDRMATNDWNPHYLAGKEYFVEGHYDKALTELTQNVADCDEIDFDTLRRQNGYFEHIWNTIPGMGQSPHAFIRASNLQWVAAALAALGQYDLAESRFTEMDNYAERCFPGRLSTFQGCSCQGLAFLLAARGRYQQAAERYRLALTHIEGNQAQIGLPPAPCVAMILVALADVELACGRVTAAEQCIRRAERVQEAQHQIGIGPAPLDRAALLTVLAAVRNDQRRSSEAYDLFAQALEVIQNIRRDHPMTAYCLDGLGEIDLQRGRLEQSESHFRQSLAVRQAAMGEGHREVAYSTYGLSRVAAAQGKEDEAASLATKASSILTRELGPTHPDAAALEAQTKRPKAPSRTGADVTRSRFLAMPTLLTVGWQVLHLGKDWRVIEANIRWREVKAAKTSGHASAPANSASTPNAPGGQVATFPPNPGR